MSGPIGSHPIGCQCPQCNGHPVGCQCYECLWSPIPGSFPGFYATWPPADSPELVELRALRAEVRELAKTQAGMMELVKRALENGKKRESR
jgi:hypothetical protein